MDLESAARELYALLPGDFTAARNARAKEAAQQGNKALAARLRGLAKPTAAAWLLNMMARHRRDATRSQAILRAAVDNISQGLLVVDAGRRVPVLNARAAELLGLPPDLARPGVAFDAVLAWQVVTGEFEGEAAEQVRARLLG